jgi:hypothetical protein
MSDTTDHRQRREPIATRIDPGALETIERLAEQRRTTPAQVARCLLEDGVRAIAAERAA